MAQTSWRRVDFGSEIVIGAHLTHVANLGVAVVRAIDKDRQSGMRMSGIEQAVERLRS